MRKVPRQIDLSQLVKTPTAGKIVEFIGPSGVGKTTTFDFLKEHVHDRWLFPSSIALNNLVDNPTTDFERAISLTLYAKMDNLKLSQISTWKYCDIICRLEVIVKQALVISFGIHPKGFFLDEGICHFFVEQIICQDEDIIKTLLRNRHFILLLSKSPATIAAQKQERLDHTAYAGLQKQNKVNQFSNETLQNISKQLDIYQQFGKLAKTYGCEVLELYTENGIGVNVQKIIEFEKNLNKL